jgi:hypothetical protein
MKSNDGNYDKCVILYQTSRNQRCALYQYNVKSNDEEREEFVSPGTFTKVYCMSRSLMFIVCQGHQALLNVKVTKVYCILRSCPNRIIQSFIVLLFLMTSYCS